MNRIMSLSIDHINPIKGLAREIIKSKGSVDVPGFVDESKLIIVKKENNSWKKVEDLKIKNIDKIISKGKGRFIGLEDPDILTINGKKHVYFTIAFKYKHGYNLYLGHAHGNSLENLEAASPVLFPSKEIYGFKESCIYENKIALNEAGVNVNNEEVSMISLSKIINPEKWEFKKIILNPLNLKYKWCSGHLSPCRFFPKDFSINNSILCLINGREKDKKLNGKRAYGKFRPGLMLFNSETCEIPWISPEPLFEDPDARTITFASDLITNKDEIIIYYHINDSVIKEHKISIEELKNKLNKINRNIYISIDI